MSLRWAQSSSKNSISCYHIQGNETQCHHQNFQQDLSWKAGSCYADEGIRQCLPSLCFHCMGSGHQAGACPSRKCCRDCGTQHHTMLHQTMLLQTSTKSTISAATTAVLRVGGHSTSLQETAIKVSSEGYTTIARALLDLGACLS